MERLEGRDSTDKLFDRNSLLNIGIIASASRALCCVQKKDSSYKIYEGIICSWAIYPDYFLGPVVYLFLGEIGK